MGYRSERVVSAKSKCEREGYDLRGGATAKHIYVLLEQAIDADPSFAPAYAELARAYNIKSRFYFSSEAERKQLIENAEVAVQKALNLNPNLPEGHYARALLLWTPAKGFPHEQAVEAYKRAIELNPNNDDAHQQLGHIYYHIGLFDKGRDELQKALKINPANTLARFRIGVVDLYSCKFEEALGVLKTIPRDSNPSLVYRATATALFELGRTDETSVMVEGYLKNFSRRRRRSDDYTRHITSRRPMR